MLRHKQTPRENGRRPTGPGATIGGYRVEEIVVRRDDGYMAARATARDGRRVALRIFPGGDEELRRQVLTLARVREGIDAPLVPVLGAGEDGGMLYIAHAVPRGETLADLLAEGPLDAATTMTLLAQVAGALEAATLLGLPHGTLTSRSIVVTNTRPRQALLLDFGVRPGRRATCADADAIAAADYCAPEAARGEPTEPATTVYALTCILVECLTGAPPFVYDRPLETLQAHLVERPPRVAHRRSGLPAALDDVVATGLNKHPSQRHASPQRLVRAAQRALGTKAPLSVPTAARRYVDAAAAAAAEAAAAARRQAAEAERPKPKKPPQRPARPERVTGRAAPRRRARLWPAPALGVVLALLASTAGFAAGHLSGGGGTAAPPPTRPQVSTAGAQRAAYARSVDAAMRQLSADRASARRQLRRARRASAQEAHARRLARAYRDARASLAKAVGPGFATQPLDGRLAAAERAYRELATAARRRNARAFRAAGADVRARERQLETAVNRLQQA
jgi:serine/threonine-protein kinase